MNVGELRAAIAGLPDDLDVGVSCYDHMHAGLSHNKSHGPLQLTLVHTDDGVLTSMVDQPERDILVLHTHYDQLSRCTVVRRLIETGREGA